MKYRDHFNQMLAYDRWAMEHVLKVLGDNKLEGSPEQKMFNHVALAQFVWMDRIHGRKPSRSAFEDPQLSIDESRDLAAECHSALESTINGTSEEDFERMIDYVDSRGNAYKNEIKEILMHVFNHGTHHRGQINMMLRQRGVTPTWIDYIIRIR